jgi:predicted phage terminase large subunit-like protein
MTSVAFPAWLLGHDPALRVICASYGQDLADKWARETRNLMRSPWYRYAFPGTEIEDRQAAADFVTSDNGGRMATSIGGALTGRGGEFLIIDDPIKPDQAISDVPRKGVNEWYSNTLVSRQNDKATGCIIIVMQRLHQEDLVGYVLEQEEWDVLSLPAIAQEDEEHIIESALGRRIWRRAAGDALHPEREPLEILAAIRNQIGQYNFAGQYLQTPTPPGGALVKEAWFQRYEPGSEPARFSLIAQSWDTANKAGELNDYSVCTTWGVVNRDIVYLLDVYRKKVGFPELKRAVLDQYRKYKPKWVIIEDKASGTQLLQDLRREIPVLKPYDPPPSTDKTIRLHAQTPYFENGKVFVPTEAPWLRDYIAELTGFPGTKFDDQVDSTTQFLDCLGKFPRPLIITDEMLRILSRPGPYSIGRRLGYPFGYPF